MKKRKVVINGCYGDGFSISERGRKKLRRLGVKFDYDFNIQRDNKHLVNLVEKDTRYMSGGNCELRVVEIPISVKYYIGSYSGAEKIIENHRVWD